MYFFCNIIDLDVILIVVDFFGYENLWIMGEREKIIFWMWCRRRLYIFCEDYWEYFKFFDVISGWLEFVSIVYGFCYLFCVDVLIWLFGMWCYLDYWFCRWKLNFVWNSVVGWLIFWLFFCWNKELWCEIGIFKCCR